MTRGQVNKPLVHTDLLGFAAVFFVGTLLLGLLAVLFPASILKRYYSLIEIGFIVPRSMLENHLQVVILA